MVNAAMTPSTHSAPASSGAKTAAASGRFDPAAHLSKQGWKGKGTALKNGHLTRPLAVVQKKTLTGVGRDRDQAVPFWDHIFAATAASLSLPASLTPTPIASPAPTLPAATATAPAEPGATSQRITATGTDAEAAAAAAGPSRYLADPRLHKTSSWQTGGSSPALSTTAQVIREPIKLPGLSTAMRIGRESARRGLYAKFLRGETISLQPTPSPEPEAAAAMPSAAPVGAVGTITTGRVCGAGGLSPMEGLTGEAGRAERRLKRRREREEEKAKAKAKAGKRIEGETEEARRERKAMKRAKRKDERMDKGKEEGKGERKREERKRESEDRKERKREKEGKKRKKRLEEEKGT